MDLDLTNPDQIFSDFWVENLFPSVLIPQFQRKAIFSQYGDLFLKVRLTAMFCRHLQQLSSRHMASMSGNRIVYNSTGPH